MIALYVVGLPLGITLLLYKHKATLFGPRSATTMARYGFLYDSYGPEAWWWEVEELVRKLLLTTVPVLFDPGSPLQVCGVCAWLSYTPVPVQECGQHLGLRLLTCALLCLFVLFICLFVLLLHSTR